MTNITNEMSGAATKNTSESLTSIITAIAAAPITRNGALTARRMNIFTPFCTVIVSFVRRFTREDVPIRSMPLYESLFMWLNSASLSSVPKP